MEPDFRPGVSDSTRAVYSEIWAVWLSYLAAREADPKFFFLATYAAFVQDSTSTATCSALRHIYGALGFELPPTRKQLEKDNMVKPVQPKLKPAPVPPVLVAEATPTTGPRLLHAPVPQGTVAVHIDHVQPGEIVRHGSTLYQRTGSCWKELDSMGKPTGRVATTPVLRRSKMGIYRIPEYTDEIVKELLQLLAGRGPRITAEMGLLDLALQMAGTTRDELLEQYAYPKEAAQALMELAATGADPMAAKTQAAR